jgi:hypothetical protein
MNYNIKAGLICKYPRRNRFHDPTNRGFVWVTLIAVVVAWGLTANAGINWLHTETALIPPVAIAATLWTALK